MSSIIWQIGLFNKLPDGKAECVECKTNQLQKFVFERNHGSLKSLTTHLFSKIHANSPYAENYRQLGEKTKDESQKKLSTFFPCSSSTLTVMDKKVVNFLVSTNSSFKVVDHPTFQSLIAPQQIKKEAHYRAEVLPEVYKQVKNKVRDELKECESISFTTDAWSGPTNNFLCLTAHGITPNWTMKNHVLAVTEFQGTHSGKEIAKLLSKIIADWEICPTKIHCFLRDSAANMKSAFSQTDVDDNGFTIQILAYENVSCGAHLLNLVVQKSIRSERVADLLKQCRKVVAHFKHSNKALGMLKDIQIFLDLPDHSLLQEVSVRWNSALGMISRLFEQREALYQYAFENRNFEMTLTNEEWGLIEEMISLLQPIEEASKMLVKSPLSAQIPIALTLHGKLYTAKLINKDIDVVRCSLVNELEKYFFALRERRVHCLSTFLDLRFKDKFLLEGRNIFLAKISSWLKEELGDFVLPLINENDEIALAPSPKKPKISLFDDLNDIASTSNKENAGPSQNSSDIDDELNKYLASGCANSREDPLTAWRQMAPKFPILSKIARKFLTAPATSVPSEATFKVARDVYDYRSWICSDVWMDILPSFDRPQLGLKIALLSDRFDVLVDAHFDGKSELAIWRIIRIRKNIEPKPKLSVLIGGNFVHFPLVPIDGTFVDFPIPDRPLHNKIRFKDLQICYIDHSVITFIRSNKPIWDRMGTKFELDVYLYAIDKHKQNNWNIFVHEIWPIFVSNIRHFRFSNGYHLDNLRRRISPTVLTDLDQLISIESGILCPDGIADDGPNATAGQALAKWVHTPRKDGQPNELRFCVYFNQIIHGWINDFKETFLRATTSVAYNVRLKLLVASQMSIVEPFELVNEMTQEKLTLMKDDNIYCLLKRCPIVGETATVWENNRNLDNLNGVYFNLEGNCIGPLSPPDQSDKKMFSTPGPSDQQKE
ncbi:hypothetical protein niasHT_005762 [Heterodera trifolii]|uniref:HAT C-terminal dimerisation domain-containing protein n=1 Tax=Heterodera trifolii TaxID=157864 RepID=A0ABD2M5P1_9BILA